MIVRRRRRRRRHKVGAANEIRLRRPPAPPFSVVTVSICRARSGAKFSISASCVSTRNIGAPVGRGWRRHVCGRRQLLARRGVMFCVWRARNAAAAAAPADSRRRSDYIRRQRASFVSSAVARQVGVARVWAARRSSARPALCAALSRPLCACAGRASERAPSANKLANEAPPEGSAPPPTGSLNLPIGAASLLAARAPVFRRRRRRDESQ